ncbi:UvrB/UvrC motif-containing protein [Aeoliella mucimassa]|uniref:UvrB/uvrC motif protein n=1 Tax=Aeoliella mucimassa TaxID=2527972 RepID=A0A518ANR2_9BACT|nr:UvrB/UvrC motif-containing protein [Aeoliella mucimassa]QDU56366.1 UvrB/uvrC motif protein [Aeoliella mucimassa]
MSPDIDPILRDWEFLPDDVTVRSITTEAGEERIQLRLELGILQMYVDGRPDGKRIHDCESWLEYHQKQQLAHDQQNPDSARYLLQPEDCAELLREGVQYYHRYLSFWHLGRYELCARDTTRNLQLFAFVRNHAKHDRDKLQFDQWRPYVTMMHARAVATPLADLEEWEAAIHVIDSGIRGLEEFLVDYGQEEHADRLSELQFLRRWRKDLLSKSGEESDEDESGDPVDQIRQQLEQAIAEERYEEAAELRDQLRQLQDPRPPHLP